jgi:hypothetical protein
MTGRPSQSAVQAAPGPMDVALATVALEELLDRYRRRRPGESITDVIVGLVRVAPSEK